MQPMTTFPMRAHLSLLVAGFALCLCSCSSGGGGGGSETAAPPSNTIIEVEWQCTLDEEAVFVLDGGAAVASAREHSVLESFDDAVNPADTGADGAPVTCDADLRFTDAAGNQQQHHLCVTLNAP